VHETHADQGSEADAALVVGSEHFVQFYESDEFLLQAVGEFIGPSLGTGEAGIVVATNAHIMRLEDVLLAQGIDLAAARASGRYVTRDAVETLSRFMVDSAPDPVRFEDVIGGLIAESASAGRRVRVYGEMVALLAMDGNHPATIRLEQLWNELQHKRSFALFCGYPMDRFVGEALGELLNNVC